MQGVFRPKNPHKYRGDPRNIIYRSSWELKLMNYIDSHPDIVEWSSEEMCIPYISPVDNRVHRYFPDFIVKKKDASGRLKTVMIEVKPFKETRPPITANTKKGKPSKAYLREVFTWGVNDAKWKAAREYCADRGWEFQIMTEYELGIKKKN